MATLALVVMQILTVAAAVATVAVQRAMIVTLRLAIVTKLATIVVRLARAPMRAIVPQLPAVAAAVAIVGTDVATITSDIAAVTAEISSVGTDVARVAAKVPRALRAKGLRSRSSLGVYHGGSTGRKRHRYAQCNQFIAKHLQILQRSVGTRPLHRAVRGGRRKVGVGVKGFPYLAFRKKDGIVPRRAGPTRFRGPSPLLFMGLRTNRGRSDSFADSQ